MIYKHIEQLITRKSLFNVWLHNNHEYSLSDINNYYRRYYYDIFFLLFAFGIFTQYSYGQTWVVFRIQYTEYYIRSTVFRRLFKYSLKVFNK